jgi:hypothetical protein
MHFSLSLMFDEASDIQMHGNLNVFVNVCLYTGEVGTFTLALKGEIVRVILPLTHNMLAINKVLLVMYVWPLLKK